MKKPYYFMLLLFMSMLLIHCSTDDKLEIITEQKNYLYLGDNIISIEGAEKQLEKVTLNASNGTLKKLDKNQYQLTLESIGKVDISIKEGETLVLSQTMDIKFNLRSYYFPIEGLSEGMVYEYQSTSDSVPPFYWYYKSFNQIGDWTLTGTCYNHDFDIEQLIQEKVVSNGTLVKRFSLYEYDASGKALPLETTIESPSLFPFAVSDTSSIFLFKMHWKSTLDTLMTNHIVRNRRFRGFDTYEYGGKPLECIEIEMREEIELDHEKEGVQTVRPITKEVYGEGIGLIYYKKWLNPTFFMEYQLVNRYSMSVFEQKVKATMK